MSAKHFLLYLMPASSKKNLICSKKPIILEDITDYKIYDLNDPAPFQAFQLKSSDEYLHP